MDELEDIGFPTHITTDIRARDFDRNKQLPPHTIAELSMNYRMYSGIYGGDYRSFLMAQHISYRNHPNTHSMRSNPDKQIKISSFNYFMEYGTTSFWQISHFRNSADTATNIFADNIILVVGIDLKTRRPTQVNDACVSICNASQQTYPKRHDMDYYQKLKSKLSGHIRTLGVSFKEGNTWNGNTYLFKTTCQLRWSDEDSNHHINSAMYMKIIEDCFSSWNEDIRNNKNRITSLTIVYWKEIRHRNCDKVHPTIWYECNGYLFGTIDVER
eukprot:46887_1